ncbi:energy-coupling factor transporter transmembrane component T family protein [Tenuibacillus multivorans]|uniref:Energy-coupling factor transporter transmembrane protein EcfT n=1 Tax=Tenuibacillus multivorans TaxID=237069 RepID=A0A1H0F7V9_9BACI|nr:energy-coupling factor transporter transmembrane component T [Tenuibacillus multivorans]GEL78037.1 energy-coupling factor transporter transmembrane protein EcfT [Tenuibacillus multivorans]SDN90758.1 energy-coupling factor transport system permease protein [Tenuibacillus multivorans]
MMGSFMVGQYIPGESLIHRLDPRLKIVMVFIYVIVVFTSETFISYLVLFAFAFLSTLLTRIPLKFVIKGLKPVWWLIAITFVLHVLLTRTGEVWIEIIGFPIYKESIIQAVKISVRFFLLILMTTILTLSTTPIAITDAVESLLHPLKKIKFPVHELALMMSISLRFIPTLMQEADKISKAQASRGLDFRTGKIKDRVQAIIPLILPLFVNAFKRAEDLAIAMEARGYQGGEGRTKSRELAFRRRDYIAGFMFILMMFIYFILTL